MPGPNPDAVHPNENVPGVCCIKNVITCPNIEAGDYTCYDDTAGGAVIGADSVAAGDIPPYTMAAGNSCRVTRPRFDPELTGCLLKLRWRDWEREKIFRNPETLCSGDLERARRIEP
ncbi:hypothetical protein [Dysosmobacter sp.]